MAFLAGAGAVAARSKLSHERFGAHLSACGGSLAPGLHTSWPGSAFTVVALAADFVGVQAPAA